MNGRYQVSNGALLEASFNDLTAGEGEEVRSDLPLQPQPWVAGSADDHHAWDGTGWAVVPCSLDDYQDDAIGRLATAARDYLQAAYPLDHDLLALLRRLTTSDDGDARAAFEWIERVIDYRKAQRSAIEACESKAGVDAVVAAFDLAQFDATR